MRSAFLIVALLAGSLAWVPIPIAPAGHREASRLDAAPPAVVFDSGDQVTVVRAYFSSRAELNWLANTFDAASVVDWHAGFVELYLRPGELDSLRQAGFRLEIDASRTALLTQPLTAGGVSGIPGYDCFRTVEETYASMAQLASDHPGLARWISIGASWERTAAGPPAGYDLHVLVLTNQARPGPKPVFFLMGAVHAREYTTAELAARFAEHLVAGYGVDPDITWLLDHFEVHIMPQANPDGRKLAEAGYLQRKNTNPTDGQFCQNPPGLFNHLGVDLNRNSSFQWGGDGASEHPCAQTYRGLAAASEPEIQAIQAYLAALFPDQRGPGLADAAPLDATGVFLTLHSYGRFVLYPWGWAHNASAPNDAQLATLGRKFGFFNDYQVCQAGACLYQVSGSNDDWVYGELGVAAFTFEMGGDFFESCTAFESVILPANMPALLYAFKAARRPYQSPAGPETLQLTASSAAFVSGQPFTLTAVADDTRYSSGGQGNEPVQNVAAARYSFGVPSWAPAAPVLPLAPADGLFDAPVETLSVVVDTAGWPPGRHLVFVESQDAAGHWGVPSAIFVTIEAPLYSASLSPAPSVAIGAAGQVVSHSLRITNTGTASAAFALSVAGGIWPHAAPGSLGPLVPGAGETLTVSITIPADAGPGSHDVAWLSVTHPSGAPALTGAALVTGAHGDVGLALLPAQAAQSGLPGSAAVYPLQLVQIGSLDDSFSFSVSGSAWPVDFPALLGPASQGQVLPLMITVTIPIGVPDGASDAAVISVVSASQPALSQTVVLTTTSAWLRTYLPWTPIQ